MLSNSSEDSSGIISINTPPNIEFSNITPICIAENHYFFTYKAQRHFKWFVIKQLNPQYNNVFPYNTLLFKEFELLNQMEHPCIVRAYGWEKVNGIDSLIIEYIDGLTLQEHLKRKDLTSADLHKIVLELASAIEYIHSKQVLHRDIKPENVMITRIGKHLKLIDFGLSDSDTHVILKSAVGTKKYCSPEQKNGEIIDTRTDIYSFGVLLDDILKILPKWHLLQWRRYTLVAKKCTNLQPINRYKDANELIKAIKNKNKANFVLLFLLLIGISYFINNSIKTKNIKTVVLQKNDEPQLVVPKSNELTEKEVKPEIENIVSQKNDEPQLVVPKSNELTEKEVKRKTKLPKPIPDYDQSFEMKATIIGSELCSEYLKKYPNVANTSEELIAAAYYFDTLSILTFEKKDALLNSIPKNSELRTKCLNAFNAEMFECMQIYGKQYSNAIENGAMNKRKNY